MLRLILPFVAGIVLHESKLIEPPGGNVVASLFVIPASILLILKTTGYRFRWISGLGIATGLLVGGWTLTEISDINDRISPVNELPDGSMRFTLVRIVDEPKIRDDGRVKARVFAGLADSTARSGTTCLAYFAADSTQLPLEAGDLLAGRALFTDPPGARNPGAFDYRNYLRHQGIRKILRFENDGHILLDKGRVPLLKKLSLSFSSWAKEMFTSQGFGAEELSVSLALILGRKQDIQSELFDRYAGAGVVHILCVSGLHVGILYLMLDMLFFPLNRSLWGRRLKLVLVLSLIWFYALVTGLSPSVTRAATMFSLVAGGRMLERDHNIFNTLASSALILLVVDPHNLYKIGFQLSYLAVFGIVSLQPSIFQKARTTNRIADKILALLTVSFCAQLATAPLSIYYFGRFPVWFLLSNLVAVPLAGILLHLAMALLIFSWIGPVRDLIGILLSKGLEALNFSVGQINSLPFSVLEGLSLNGVEVALLYTVLFSFVFLVRTGNLQWFRILLSLMICYMAFGSFDYLRRAKSTSVTIYNVPGHTAIGLASSGRHVMLSDSALKNDKQAISYNLADPWRKQKLGEPEWVTIPDTCIADGELFFVEKNFIGFFDKTIILIDTNYRFIDTGRKLRTDYLVIRGDPYLSIPDLAKNFDFKRLIFDASCKPWNIDRWIEEAEELGVDYYSVKDEGAFIIELRAGETQELREIPNTRTSDSPIKAKSHKKTRKPFLQRLSGVIPV